MTLCGELAGKPISAMALIGLGYRSISMSAASIGPVKAMLAELPVALLAEKLDALLAKPSSTEDTRAMLKGFAVEHGIPL